MSAGGISYSGLTTQPKVTLPSVDMWGTNMNILKNPLRSVTTRRVDKVGDTQNILLEQDASGDRIAEAIQVYPRGVNPMVSVSYDSASNNGGALTSGLQNSIGQATLPYKVQNVRPPIYRQEDLAPLSRLPRVWCHADTNPAYPAFKSQRSCAETQRSIVANPLHTEVSAGCFNNTMPTITEDEISRALHDQKKNIHADTLQQEIVLNPKAPFGQHSALTTEAPVNAVSAHALVAPKETARASAQWDSLTDHVDRTQLVHQKAVDKNKVVYEAFTMLGGTSRQQEGGTDYGWRDVKRHIHDQLLWIDARTNPRAPVSQSPIVTSAHLDAIQHDPRPRTEVVASRQGRAAFAIERGASKSAIQSDPLLIPAEAPRAMPSVSGGEVGQDAALRAASVVPSLRTVVATTQRTDQASKAERTVPLRSMARTAEHYNTPLHDWSAPRQAVGEADAQRWMHEGSSSSPGSVHATPVLLASAETALRSQPERAMHQEVPTFDRVSDRLVSQQSFHIPASHVPLPPGSRRLPRNAAVTANESWSDVKQRAVRDYHARNVHIRA